MKLEEKWGFNLIKPVGKANDCNLVRWEDMGEFKPEEWHNSYVSRVTDDVLSIDIVVGRAEAERAAFHAFVCLFICATNIYSASTRILSTKTRGIFWDSVRSWNWNPFCKRRGTLYSFYKKDLNSMSDLSPRKDAFPFVKWRIPCYIKYNTFGSAMSNWLIKQKPQTASASISGFIRSDSFWRGGRLELFITYCIFINTLTIRSSYL